MKRLYRSRRDKVIAGVASGIAEYFEVDPTLVRLVWVIAAFSGVGVLAYIVAAIVIPERPEGMAHAPQATPPRSEASHQPEGESQQESHEKAVTHAPGKQSDSARTFGIILVILGGFLLVRRAMPWFMVDRLWPLALIALGVYFLLNTSRGDR